MPLRVPTPARLFAPLLLLVGFGLCAVESPSAAEATAVAGPAGPAGPTGPTAATAPTADADRPPRRLVSLNPSLSAIVVRLGAGALLVGVDDYTVEVLPQLGDRPRVGGLFDPNLEAVLALRPDRVLVVAGLEQAAHAEALRRVGLQVEVFENERYDQVLENVARIGRLVGREGAAAGRIAEIRGVRTAIEGIVRGRARPRTLIVLDRSPLYLVGGETFLDELLRAVGAENLGARVAQGYPRGSLEWLVAARPELLIDLSPQAGDALAFWSRWPSLPAVASRRVLSLDATLMSLPGPALDDALRALLRAVHGPALEAELARALAAHAPEAAVARPGALR